MPKPRAKRSPGRFKPACPPGAIVDQGFVPVRAKLIELAAFFDRVERYAASGDFRCVALRKAAALLLDGRPARARRILEALSDPTTLPDNETSGKVALGAWQPAAGAGAKVKGRVKVPATASINATRPPNRG